MIKNDMKFWEPVASRDLDRQDFYFIFSTIMSVGSLIATPILFFGGGYALAPLLLLALLMYPIGISFEDGNSLKRLGTEVRRDYHTTTLHHSTKSSLWLKYRALPEAVKKDIAVLTVEDILEMNNDQAIVLNTKIQSLRDAYNENQRALASPKVEGFVHSIEDATNTLRTHTTSLKKAELR
jgi:hypothetical protein